MKRYFFLLLAVICCGVKLYAQLPKPVLSEPFDEPDGYKQIILTDDGKTIFLILENESVAVNIYDKSHKLINHVENKDDIWNKDNYRWRWPKCEFVAGNSLVIFLQTTHKDEYPELHRISLSLETGKVIDNELTGIITPEDRPQRRAAKYVDDGQYYQVKKDKYSDAYAVVSYFGQDIDGAVLPIVIHYNSQNKEIGRSKIKSPGDKFAFSYYRDMIVIDTQEVWVFTSPFNNGKGNRASSAVMITKLRGNEIASVLLQSWSSQTTADGGVINYDPKHQTIHVYTSTILSIDAAAKWGPGAERSVFTYSTNIAAIDRQNMGITYNKSLNHGLSTKFRNANYDISRSFSGIPKKMNLHDGITTILSEEIGDLPSHDIGIVDYDSSGNAVDGLLIRKGTASGYRGGAGWAESGFYDFDYLRTPTSRYVFFNDHPGNFERNAEKSPKKLIGVGDANSVCFQVTGRAVNKYYLFGEPDSEFDNRFANFSVKDYSDATGEYAIMIIEGSGRKKQARIAWLRLM